MDRRVLSRSEEETEALGEELARDLGGDGTVLLVGDLGSGKTVLVRGLARALGIDRAQVLSPTYALIHEYEGSSGRLIHVDLYRLAGEEVDTLGLDELLASPGLVAVEWAERLAGSAVEEGFRGALRVRLRTVAHRSREIVVARPEPR